MNCIKLWWKTRILKQVVYKPNGRPYDCKGLQFVGKEPFGADTKYLISDHFSGYHYLGYGSYASKNYRSFHKDLRNPYVAERIRAEKKRFHEKYKF